MTNVSHRFAASGLKRSRAGISPFWPLLALAIGTFAIGTSEFMPMGLMPVIARDLGISVPVAGQLVGIYAIGVMIGAPFMTLMFGGMRMRVSLVTLMAIFTAGNLLSAVAGDYSDLVIARLLTSLSHGAFFGLGAVAAVKVAAPNRQGSAIAAVFAGLTVANIGGVPGATWIGQQIGWRSAFYGATALGIVAMIALWRALPHIEVGKPPDAMRELRVLTRPAVLLLLVTTVMTAGAMFTLYTYVAPMLTKLVGASANLVTLALAVIGLGFAVGNVVGGKLADWSTDRATRGVLAALAVAMMFLPLAMRSQVGALIGLFVWGVVTFAAMPSLQTKLMQLGAEAPGLASSINIGAFNVGNAIGAFVGAGVLGLGLGYQSLPVAGALLAILAAIFATLVGKRS